MDLNELYKEIEKAEVDLNAKRLKYIKEALVENGGSIKLKFKEFKEFKETNDAFDFDDQFPVIIEIAGDDFAKQKHDEFYAYVKHHCPGFQSDWFKIDKEIFMQPENKNKAFILGTRKTGCDLIILGGTNCDEGSMDWLFGSLGNENFYVCKPLSFYKSQQEIQKVNPLYAFKVATAYFREQGKVPVFEDSNCRLIKL